MKIGYGTSLNFNKEEKDRVSKVKKKGYGIKKTFMVGLRKVEKVCKNIPDDDGDEAIDVIEL